VSKAAKKRATPHASTENLEFAGITARFGPLGLILMAKKFHGAAKAAHAIERLRWSRFLRQAVKVDLMTKRMIHHEDTQAVHG